jgi:hypothetical protein
VRPLGSLDDQYNVAIESPSGKSEIITTFTVGNMRPDLFAETVAFWQGELAANEANA